VAYEESSQITEISFSMKGMLAAVKKAANINNMFNVTFEI
jgi:hypothetical protein